MRSDAVGSVDGDQPRADLHRVAAAASRIRAAILFVILDAVTVVIGYGLAEVTYFHNRAPSNYWLHFTEFLAVAVVVTILCNRMFGLYGRMWRHAGADEARQLLLSVATTLCILIAFWPIGQTMHIELVPPVVVVVGCMFTAGGMGVIRFHSRLFAWQRGSKRLGLRVAVIGSRDAGAAAIREMLRSPGAGLVPVAVFDDDRSAHGLSLLGVPVVGGIDDIPKATSRYTIQQVLLTIPSPSPELVERSLRASELAGVSMKMLPGVKDMLSEPNHLAALRQAREPQIEDLLGRTPVPTDLESVRRSIEGHRVLVTGAGGSIGSEICRQLSILGPAELVLLDHDETHLHDTAATLIGPAEQALVDIFDREAVFDTFERYRPEVVFHAAAHKHVPVLEQHPLEAAKTNVLGTLNVVDAAAFVGTTRFVQISTDKAVHPSSVMGASKRMAEQTVLAHAPEGGAYCTVRFGNVLGSRGSVIPTFARQIAQGGPVTVTDPRMTRFFMSVEEAVQLVLQASVLSDGGEIFMLEMGVPVRIIDLAERMIRLSGCQVGIDIPIEITGMRPGEKLNEVLSTPDEEVLSTSHPYINRLVPMRAPAETFAAELEELELATLRRDKETVRGLLFTAGVTPDAIPSTTGSDPVASASFEWPELEDAEADLDLRSMVAGYMSQPEVDPDQVNA
ncbi:MAG: nucleoside-diphosphate sugar epimerase/dehydratase [Acidimicrobiales bacterium]|jgi:FlaA1/EpsC-like NDP-sugar epimerase